MDLEVFSDPVWGLGGKNGITASDLAATARYDEALIKPAVLIADEVVLRTWREDMRRAEIVQGNSIMLPVPFVGSIIGVVDRRSPQEMSLLGVSEDLLRRLELALGEVVDRGENPALSDEFLLGDAAQEFADLVYGLHRERFDSMGSTQLERAVSAGVLRIEPWDDRPPTSWPQAVWDHANTSFPYGWERMTNSMTQGSAVALLLDYGIGDRLAAADHGMDFPSVKTLSNAAELLRMLDGLADAPLDELLDIREELAPYLRPFRGFLLSHASGMGLDIDAPIAERRRKAAIVWEAEVEPAVREMEANVTLSRFRSQLSAAMADGAEVAVGIGLGLATSLASGAIGFTALAGLGTAALPTVVKATAKTLRARKAMRAQGGAFFLYDVERRLRRSRRSTS